MKRVCILVTNGVQDEEFIYPYYRLREEKDIELNVLTPDGEGIKGKYGVPCKKENVFGSFQWLINNDYDAAIIPGGWECPEKLRMDDRVTSFLTRLNRKNDAVISAICHGPQVLISAGIVRDRFVTAFKGIHHDLHNAGGLVVEQEIVVVDKSAPFAKLVTAPHYRNNPEWMKTTIDLIKS